MTAAKRVYIYWPKCIFLRENFFPRERVGFEHPTSREQVIYVNHSRQNDRLMYRAQTVIIAQSIFFKFRRVYGSGGRVATGATVATSGNSGHYDNSGHCGYERLSWGTSKGVRR